MAVLSNTLADFLDHVLPPMLDRGYAFKAAKSEGYQYGRHTADYYVDQSIRTHVLNGLFAITRLLIYLERENIFRIDDSDFCHLLALFTTHDLHKDKDVNKGRRGEFDISLEDIITETEALGIPNFTNTTPAQHRWAMVHLQSPKVGDLSDAPAGTSRLSSLLRLADTLASMQTARECDGAQNRLNEILSQVTFRYPERVRQFYWHELDDYRGLSTLMIHHATAAILEKFGLFPLLYFPNGILYIGPESVDFGDVDTLRKAIAEETFTGIQANLASQAATIAVEAIKPQQTVKVDKYAYLFTNRHALLRALADFAAKRGIKQLLTTRLSSRLTRQFGRDATDDEIHQQVADFATIYGIDPVWQDDDVFSQNWACVWKFAEGVDSIARALVGKDGVRDWLFALFSTPSAVQMQVNNHWSELTAGLVGDHCLVIAYHYLMQTTFDGRSANQVEAPTILNHLVTQADSALADYDTVDHRLSFVNDELGLQTDMDTYLTSHLNFSFAYQRDIPMVAINYARPRSGAHGRLCVICNREIPREMGDSTIKTNIVEGNALVFSNRLVPTGKVGGQMKWCPMCYLEFMLRKLMGMGYAGGDPAISDRLFLYLLPDYSFTPDFWEHSGDVLYDFNKLEVFGLKLRQYGKDDDLSLPSIWLKTEGKVDNVIVTEVARLFQYEAKRLKEPTKSGLEKGKSVGERLHCPKVEYPNYLMLIYEVSAYTPRAGQPDFSPTRSEIWTKATYAGCLLHLLLGVRVYITDKPYLPITRPDEMTAVVQLDSPHSLLRGVLDGKTSLTLGDLPLTLTILSAAWEANNALSGGNGNLDKQIATLLERINIEPLAGAGFYKEREREEKAVYDTFRLACVTLLTWRGGDKLDLAQRLTEQSLKLFIPRSSNKLFIPRSSKRGKAHRYETVFRTCVEVVKKHPKADDSELIAKVAGALAKRLERIDGGATPLYGDERTAAVAE
ncbi:MAG: type I-D CRISPR-associated protein Cas10d/Csc3, partial [Candidatus Latescibacteria bacterium]|nr:type I-D CRISPR-associated protein Cas10d/Csc3 [Candidatus Latescibacterota bacterium]